MYKYQKYNLIKQSVIKVFIHFITIYMKFKKPAKNYNGYVYACVHADVGISIVIIFGEGMRIQKVSI